MITKEQALTCKNFVQVKRYCNGVSKLDSKGRIIVNYTNIEDCKPAKWRANGQCKTWKRSPERFKLPIKHGLYNYGYITEENAHLFEAAYESIGG